ETVVRHGFQGHHVAGFDGGGTGGRAVDARAGDPPVGRRRDVQYGWGGHREGPGVQRGLPTGERGAHGHQVPPGSRPAVRGGRARGGATVAEIPPQARRRPAGHDRLEYYGVADERRVVGDLDRHAAGRAGRGRRRGRGRGRGRGRLVRRRGGRLRRLRWTGG